MVAVVFYFEYLGKLTLTNTDALVHKHMVRRVPKVW